MNTDTSEPAPMQPPLTRTKGLLDGLIRCDCCDEPLVGATDANGNGWLVHLEDIPYPSVRALEEKE